MIGALENESSRFGLIHHTRFVTVQLCTLFFNFSDMYLKECLVVTA